MVSATRGVQLCEVGAALLLLLLGVLVLLHVHDAANAAKNYEHSQVAASGSTYVEHAPPVLPVARCERNATGCCDLPDAWQADYIFCDAACAAVVGEQLADLCVSDIKYFTSAVDKADDIIAWAVFTPVAVLVLAVLAAAGPPGVSKARAGCLCCVHLISLVPMVVGLVFAFGLAAILTLASQDASDACVFICKDAHGVPLPESNANALKCALIAQLDGEDCSAGGCCFQSDLDDISTLAGSTRWPLSFSVAVAVLAGLMSCCSLHTCACGTPDAPPVAGRSIHDPLIVPAATVAYAQ
jgi:hypothetical protein